MNMNLNKFNEFELDSNIFNSNPIPKHDCQTFFFFEFWFPNYILRKNPPKVSILGKDLGR